MDCGPLTTPMLQLQGKRPLAALRLSFLWVHLNLVLIAILFSGQWKLCKHSCSVEPCDAVIVVLMNTTWIKWNQCSAAAKLSTSALEVIVTFPTALSITVPTPCLKLCWLYLMSAYSGLWDLCAWVTKGNTQGKGKKSVLFRVIWQAWKWNEIVCYWVLSKYLFISATSTLQELNLYFHFIHNWDMSRTIKAKK